MEANSEKNYPHDTPAYETYIQDIYHENQTLADVFGKLRQFRDSAIVIDSQERISLAAVLDSVLKIYIEEIDINNPAESGKMFLSGAVVGLYIGDEMTHSLVPVADVLAMSGQLLSDNSHNFTDDVMTIMSQMSLHTKDIIIEWKQGLCGDAASDMFFHIGLGMMLCSVNKITYEIDMFHHLEESVTWEQIGEEPITPIALQSLDEDCLRLAEAFQEHLAAGELNTLSESERAVALEKVGKLLEVDLSQMSEFQIGDNVQTRGMGVYMCLEEEREGLVDVCGYDNEIKLKGIISNIECMWMPTEFALLTGIDTGNDAYEDVACVVLDSVELIDPSGQTTPIDGSIALPLRTSGTTQLDKIIYQAGQ